MSWRLGTQSELCECCDCASRTCDERSWIAFSMIDRFICKLRGHIPSDRRTNVTACKRRCGYVFQEDLPSATLVRR